jgi:hypothetical protein
VDRPGREAQEARSERVSALLSELQRFSDLQSQSSPDPGRSRSPAASAEPQSVPSVELSSACHTMSAISRVSNPMNCVQVMRRPFGTRPLSLRSPPHLMFLMTILIFDET